jgi:hypothetical protein
VVEPVPLDFLLPLHVIREQVAIERHPLRGDAEVVSKERGETRDQVGVGVRDSDAVAGLVALGPVEHAARGIRGVELMDEPAAIFLISASPLAGSGSLTLRGDQRPSLTPSFKCAPLRFCQRNIANPETDGRARDAE